MTSKTISFEFEYDHDYTLISIHSTLEDFRIAFFLNKHLNIKLQRSEEDLDFPKKKCKFSLFSYEDESTFTSWSLIANKHSFTRSVNSGPAYLFNEETKLAFLIPEKKQVDYFIKISRNIDQELLQNTLLKINNTYQTITSYSVDPYALKSKENLIF